MKMQSFAKILMFGLVEATVVMGCAVTPAENVDHGTSTSASTMDEDWPEQSDESDESDESTGPVEAVVNQAYLCDANCDPGPGHASKRVFYRSCASSWHAAKADAKEACKGLGTVITYPEREAVTCKADNDSDPNDPDSVYGKPCGSGGED